MSRLSSSLIALATTAALSATAQASVTVSLPTQTTLVGVQPVSPAFDGWSTAGDVSALDDHTLLLTTAYDASDDGGVSVVVGTGAIVAQQPGGVEELAGLSIGDLDTTVDGVLHQAQEGSVITRTLNVRAGDTVSFRWQLLSNEDPLAGLPDLAFVTLGGQLFELGSVGIADQAGSAGFQHGSVWMTFTHTFAGTGLLALNNIELAVGVVDRGDTATSSALAIQGVTVTPVPEPTSWGLLVSGLMVCGGLAAARRRARG